MKKKNNKKREYELWNDQIEWYINTIQNLWIELYVLKKHKKKDEIEKNNKYRRSLVRELLKLYINGE